MGPTWVLLAPDGPHVGPMNIAFMDATDTVANMGYDQSVIYIQQQ